MTTFARTTVRDVLDRAQSRHWSFGGVQMPPGAIVQLINERQRLLLLQVVEAWEALVGETQDIATGILASSNPPVLVALDDNDVPYYTTTGTPVYGLAYDANNVPYVDTSTPLSIDPFGENGAAPGLPLPDDLLRVIACTVLMASDTTTEYTVEILEQNVATRPGAGHQGVALKAFVNHNRLVPVRIDTTDNWSQVTTLRLSVVRSPVLSALTDELTIPEPLIGALIAHACEFLATAARDCPEADKRRFEAARREQEEAVRYSAPKILQGVTSASVVYIR